MKAPNGWELHEYQRGMIQFAADKLLAEDTGVMLAADPGCGKTVCSLEIANMLIQLGEVERVLLTAPIRVLDLVWPAEIAQWSYPFTYQRFNGPPGRRVGKAQIDMISRDSLHHMEAHASKYDLLIVDESSAFRNWGTKRTRSLRKLCKRIPKRLLLTGTPMPNTHMDLFPQAWCMDKGEALGKNVSVFRRRFCYKGGWQGKEWKLNPGAGEKIQDAVEHLCYRVEAEKVLDMPELTTNDVMVELPPKALAQQRELKEELALELANDTILAANAAVAYGKLRQLANGSIKNGDTVCEVHTEKRKALDDLISEMPGRPILVFYQYNADLDSIRRVVPKAAVLRGGMSGSQVQTVIDDWMDPNSGTKVLAAQERTASHGLNLQTGGCCDCIFYSLGDSSDAYDQAYRRIYRQGAGKRVRVHRLLAKDSVDEIIRDRVSRKLQGQKAFLDALRSFAT